LHAKRKEKKTEGKASLIPLFRMLGTRGVLDFPQILERLSIISLCIYYTYIRRKLGARTQLSTQNSFRFPICLIHIA
jgi:hypothetical protein